jgi:hypothetical protein
MQDFLSLLYSGFTFEYLAKRLLISFSFHFIYLHATNPLQGHRTQDKDNSPTLQKQYMIKQVCIHLQYCNKSIM